MRTLNLHTECYQPMLKTWAGISVFNSIRIKPMLKTWAGISVFNSIRIK